MKNFEKFVGVHMDTSVIDNNTYQKQSDKKRLVQNFWFTKNEMA